MAYSGKHLIFSHRKAEQWYFSAEIEYSTGSFHPASFPAEILLYSVYITSGHLFIDKVLYVWGYQVNFSEGLFWVS